MQGNLISEPRPAAQPELAIALVVGVQRLCEVSGLAPGQVADLANWDHGVRIPDDVCRAPQVVCRARLTPANTLPVGTGQRRL